MIYENATNFSIIFLGKETSISLVGFRFGFPPIEPNYRIPLRSPKSALTQT